MHKPRLVFKKRFCHLYNHLMHFIIGWVIFTHINTHTGGRGCPIWSICGLQSAGIEPPAIWYQATKLPLSQSHLTAFYFCCSWFNIKAIVHKMNNCIHKKVLIKLCCNQNVVSQAPLRYLLTANKQKGIFTSENLLFLMQCVWSDLKWVNGPFPFPLWKIKALLTAMILFNLVLCEVIYNDLSLHVPFMLKCFFLNEVLIIIHTPVLPPGKDSSPAQFHVEDFSTYTLLIHTAA